MVLRFTRVDDERLHARVPVWAEVALARDGDPDALTATLVDISEGGALVQAPWSSPWCDGEELRLRFEGAPETLACLVVAVEPAMGATCLHLAFADASAQPEWLQSLLAGAGAEPSDMPRWQAAGAALLEHARMAPIH